MHPQLVFGKKFFSALVYKKVGQRQQLEVSTTISNILLLHTGRILKFHLYIPQNLPLLYTDLWIKIITNSGISKLELFNKPLIPYKMPSYLFSCLELTHLSLSNCILKPPRRFKGFRKLIHVNLESVKITADISFGTQLEALILEKCTGIENLGCQFKYNNNLRTLEIMDSEKIDCQWFECTKKLKVLGLRLYRESSNSRKEVISLDKLLGNLPEISGLHIYGFSLQCSESGASVLKRLKTMEKMHTLSLSCAGFCDLV
ncbi:hypothetical protein POM88_047993 [Heracleum sosnowskyi]|uniref:At1g61320/AtMIF1 LRR domain-containing protein n=1 Tax=Heracleum sosnowskyi TaxID=360622 RepID=A0AAD8M058_9APIA|nr:hypothetical protein POM88_047993 [Heracleum sosnowskyi]